MRLDDLDFISKKQDKRQKAFIFLLLCVVFIAIYQLYGLFPLYADDWNYAFWRNPTSEGLDNIFVQIWKQQSEGYLHWGGRSVAHSLIQLLAWMGEGWSDLICSFVYVGYIYLMYRICNLRHSSNLLLCMLIFFTSSIAIPAFSNAVLWLSGAGNYLFGTAIILGFIFPYYTYYITENSKNSVFKTILFFVLGIIAGWTNENLFLAVVFFLIVLFFLMKRDQLKIPSWAIVGFVGVCIGGSAMLFAPGNYVRADMVANSLGLTDASLIDNILYRVMKVGYRYVLYVLPLVILYGVMYYFFKKDDVYPGRKKTLQGSLLFFFTAHVACFVMVASPIFPYRALFGIVSLMVVSVGILYAGLNIRSRKGKLINNIVIGLLGCIVTCFYCLDCIHLGQLRSDFEERVLYIEQQKKEGNKFIIFDKPIQIPERYQIEDLSEDSQYWLNELYAKFYEIDSVKVVRNK